jgi:hypothetical protein
MTASGSANCSHSVAARFIGTHGRLRLEQIVPSAPAMLGSGLPAHSASLSELGIRAEMTQPEPAFSARHGRRESTRRRIRRPGAAGGFAWPDHARSPSTLAPRLAPLRSSQAPKNSGRSRVRTCGPSLVRRVRTVAGRGPVWHLPATTVAGRGLAWPDAGGRWLPVGSPISLAPLTFNKHERRPETRHRSRPERPSGSDRGRARCPSTRPPAVSAPDRRRTRRRSTSGAHRRGRSGGGMTAP